MVDDRRAVGKPQILGLHMLAGLEAIGWYRARKTADAAS